MYGFGNHHKDLEIGVTGVFIQERTKLHINTHKKCHLNCVHLNQDNLRMPTRYRHGFFVDFKTYWAAKPVLLERDLRWGGRHDFYENKTTFSPPLRESSAGGRPTGVATLTG